MEKLGPSATARVTCHKTKTGVAILKVAVFSPDIPDRYAFRTYHHEVGGTLDQAIAKALRSCGLVSAWVWGRLP